MEPPKFHSRNQDRKKKHHPHGRHLRRQHDDDDDRARHLHDSKGSPRNPKSYDTRPRIPVRPSESSGPGPPDYPEGRNDYFVQSWLAQTQAHRLRPQNAYDQERPRKISPPVRSHKHGEKATKRRRSPSGSPSVSSELHKPVENSFERRSRYKTREDKYDYKKKWDGRRGAHTEGRSRGGKRHREMDEYDRETPPSLDANGHKAIAGLGNKQGASNISLNHPTNAPNPGTSRTKKSRHQDNEDRELEDISEFFVRRRSNGKAAAQKSRSKTRRRSGHEGPASDGPAAEVRGRRCHASTDISLVPSPSVEGESEQNIGRESRGRVYQTSNGSSSRYNEPTGARPSSRSTTYFTWSASESPQESKEKSRNGPRRKGSQGNSPSSTQMLLPQSESAEGARDDRPNRDHREKPEGPARRPVYKDVGLQTLSDTREDQGIRTQHTTTIHQEQGASAVDESNRPKLHLSGVTIEPQSRPNESWTARHQPRSALPNNGWADPVQMKAPVQSRVVHHDSDGEWIIYKPRERGHGDIHGQVPGPRPIVTEPRLSFEDQGFAGNPATHAYISPFYWPPASLGSCAASLGQSGWRSTPYQSPLNQPFLAPPAESTPNPFHFDQRGVSFQDDHGTYAQNPIANKNRSRSRDLRDYITRIERDAQEADVHADKMVNVLDSVVGNEKPRATRLREYIKSIEQEALGAMETTEEPGYDDSNPVEAPIPGSTDLFQDAAEINRDWLLPKPNLAMNGPLMNLPLPAHDILGSAYQKDFVGLNPGSFPLPRDEEDLALIWSQPSIL
ncbi:hypothetical protein B0T19DRAFT_41047 [Cercophora scortea]|uniref:Uncharacterized protein n=1 Tax=Cercophora scortea TaxID=314031 RepID=A0AAE0J402_9PEZI|nr:hypothetical protein B0T19DRAFT_41047 [Cercophora scortea]